MWPQCRRLFFCLCAVVLVLSTAFAAARPVLGVGSRLGEELERGERLAVALDRECSTANDRNEAKYAVAAAVVEGRLTLWQAAARFHDLHGRPAEYPELFRQRNPGHSDGERLCRNVIAWVRGNAEPKQGSAVATRLEQELQSRLEAGDILPVLE